MPCRVLDLEKGALRCSETLPWALCQRCETLNISLAITCSSCLLPDCFQKCPCFYYFCPLQYTEMDSPSTVSVWNQTCPLYLCSPDRKSVTHVHTANSTKQSLACPTVTNAFESQSCKSVTIFINRRSSRVSFSVPTPQGLFFLNIIGHAMFV
jgi:hypothetical protein